MNPNLSRPGFSFKGAEQYLSQDKQPPSEIGNQRIITRERVEWISTRNLMTDDSGTAVKIMIATARDADRLKQSAGIKNTGRKSAAHVQTLSLAWHPSEVVNRDEMERISDDVIKLLEVTEHQVVVFCHNDTDHPHIHLLINRVHPETGVMAGLSNGKRKLDQWAHEYEKQRGLIVSPNRDAKYQRQEKAKKQFPDAQKRRDWVEQKRKAAAEKSTVTQPKSDRWNKLKAAQTRREKSAAQAREAANDVLLEADIAATMQKTSTHAPAPKKLAASAGPPEFAPDAITASESSPVDAQAALKADQALQDATKAQKAAGRELLRVKEALKTAEEILNGTRDLETGLLKDDGRAPYVIQGAMYDEQMEELRAHEEYLANYCDADGDETTGPPLPHPKDFNNMTDAQQTYERYLAQWRAYEKDRLERGEKNKRIIWEREMPKKRQELAVYRQSGLSQIVGAAFEAVRGIFSWLRDRVFAARQTLGAEHELTKKMTLDWADVLVENKDLQDHLTKQNKQTAETALHEAEVIWERSQQCWQEINARREAPKAQSRQLGKSQSNGLG